MRKWIVVIAMVFLTLSACTAFLTLSACRATHPKEDEKQMGGFTDKPVNTQRRN